MVTTPFWICQGREQMTRKWVMHFHVFLIVFPGAGCPGHSSGFPFSNGESVKSSDALAVRVAPDVARPYEGNS
jgi:hypothetical protein